MVLPTTRASHAMSSRLARRGRTRVVPAGSNARTLHTPLCAKRGVYLAPHRAVCWCAQDGRGAVVGEAVEHVVTSHGCHSIQVMPGSTDCYVRARLPTAPPARTHAVQFHPPWGSVHFCFTSRTHAPWGVRAASLRKSKKIPLRKIVPLFFMSTHAHPACVAAVTTALRQLPRATALPPAQPRVYPPPAAP